MHRYFLRLAVLWCKVTNFEWYTQPCRCTGISCAWLFYGAKLQILNDIHNQPVGCLQLHAAVLWCKVTNFEWYTQPAKSTPYSANAVLWCKVTNFEWYTQRLCGSYVNFSCCFMVQSYKFWMIYTTNLSDVCSCMQLFYGAKLQILNDIHNSPSRRVRAAGSCFMVQSYKFWMIYTTNSTCFSILVLLFYGAKLQILNDIHNQLDLLLHLGLAVLWCKVTNFEWYTQQHPSYDLLNQAVLWCKVTNFEWYTQL